MEKKIEEHQKIQTFGNEVKQKVDEAIFASKTPEELKEIIASLCVKCLLPASSDCEICNGTQANDEIYLNFESLEE